MSVGKRRQGQAQASGCWIRPAKRLALYLRDGFRCGYCGTDLRHAAPADVTLDHLIPRSAGGGNESENLVTCCRKDNSGRGDRPWMDYATPMAAERIQTLRHLPINLPLAKAIVSGEIELLVEDVEALR